MRAEHDFYETPVWQTRALLRHGGIPPRSRIVDPAVGDEAITKVLTRGGHTIVSTCDIDERRPAIIHADSTKADTWAKFPVYDWVVTNPPFSVAFPILEHAMDRYIHQINNSTNSEAGGGIALLLRLTFLEPTNSRGSWYTRHGGPSKIIVLPRTSYRGGKTDSVTTAWMLWHTDAMWHEDQEESIVIVSKAERDNLQEGSS